MIGNRVGYTVKYPEESFESMDKLITEVQKEFEKQKRELLIKKSTRVLKWKMRHGYDGDDIIKNMYTVVFTGIGYKVPRIVKNMLINDRRKRRYRKSIN